MKTLIGLLLTGWLAVNSWYYNLDEARQLAKNQHKYILLNFSGSDWCAPCILLRRQILDNPGFLQMADTSLILVNADFPRNKRNQLSAQQQALNNSMADTYNSQGKFPYTVLLNADGKVLKAWDGLPKEKPADFAQEVRTAIDTHP